MKRSEVINLIAAWAKPEILQDVYSNDTQEWADNFLYTLETELGFKRVVVLNEDECHIEELIYEPEEGWDAWLEKKNKEDEARDFRVVEGGTQKAKEIAQQFLHGKSFEELADQHNVTRERIRQIVAKERRRYEKSKE